MPVSMDLCQDELEKLVIDNGDDDGDGHGCSDGEVTVRARSSSVHSDPFDEELPRDFKPRKLEWFFHPRPNPKKPISMFWTDHEGFYAVPRTGTASTGKSEESKGKLGTMGLLERWFVPRRDKHPDIPKWTIGAPLSNYPLRRVSVDANDISHLSLARPPTPPRKSSRHEETMNDKPLPPLPRPRRFASVGDRPLFVRGRSQSTPGEFTLGMGSASASEGATESEIESIINSYEDSTKAERGSEEVTANEEDSHETEHPHIAGPYLLRRLQHYEDDQLEAIARMEVALGNPNMSESLRSKFLTWSQQLLDLHSPFRININPAYGEEAKITEKDAHTVVDWAINVGTKMNITQDHIFDCLNAGNLAQAQLRSMVAGVDIHHDPPLHIEELYHKMAEVIHKTCRSPRMHEVTLLISFLYLFDRLLYGPFQVLKDRIMVVRDELPHDPAPIPLNIATPLSLLKRVLDTAYQTYHEYTYLTRQIRGEFFVPIENRIPGVSSRTQGYLNNVVGPSNVI